MSASAIITDNMARGCTEVPQRDRDLMDADDYLTDTKLDSLWDWYCAANRQKMDPQMIFIKLVNSARKPYRDNLLRSRGLFSPGTTRYTPSEYTTTEDIAEGQQLSDESKDQSATQALHTNLTLALDSLQTKQIIVNQLQDRIKAMDQEQQEYEQKVQDEKKKLELDLETIRAEYEQHHSPTPIRVAIKVGNSKDERFIQIVNGQPRVHVATPSPPGTTISISAQETFELLRHSNNMVSFKSTFYPNTYLSADASKVRNGVNNPGGSVGCSNSCGSAEKFWIHRAFDAKVGIELVDFQDRFLNVWLNKEAMERTRTAGYVRQRMRRRPTSGVDCKARGPVDAVRGALGKSRAESKSGQNQEVWRTEAL
ncbi:hypothetical protein BDZ91DRAFT_783587 [Kalaharituber pfeilii]|nr:hypothetical protein BDZ91DRAFT_783587 [Kalaharituber pfeilii]